MNLATTWEAYRRNPISPCASSDELLTKLQVLARFFSLQPGHINNKDEEFSLLQSVLKNLVVPDYLMKVGLSPSNMRGIDMSEIPSPLEIERILQEASALQLLPTLRSTKSSYEEIIDRHLAGCDPSVLLLGTASMRPGKYRNVSGIWIGDFGGSFLFDCGEGSFAQLYRHFGENTWQRVSELDCILITHLHADHQMGIVKVIYERAQLNPNPITIIAPARLQVYLKMCELLLGKLNFRFERIDGRKFEVNQLEVQTVPVDHRIEAYGFIVTHSSGWKIVYSGDTRPCPALAEAGKGATLLIHEATFDDDLLQNAIDNYHSTTGQALSIGASMDAWKVILTHFSQRYSKIPENTDVDAIIAFDLLKFKLSEAGDVVSEMSAIARHFNQSDS